ncbi:MAG: hypothetical protein D6683_04870, partial [Actinomyces sp.]
PAIATVGGGGRSEQSPGEVLDRVVDALAAVLGGGGFAPVALGVAAQGGSVVGLDPNGVPVGPLTTWMDTRAAGIVAEWRAGPQGARIRELSGWNPATGLGLSTLARIHRDGGGPPAAVTTWGGADTLVLAHLTGRVVTTPSSAATLQLFDPAEGRWSPELCALAGIRTDALPTLVDAGAVVGALRDGPAAAAGLPAGIPVHAGGHDQTCAAYGLGVVEPGHVLLGCGTAWVVTVVAEESVADRIPAELNVSRHVVAGRITASELVGDVGAAFERMVQELYGPSDDPATFTLVDHEVAQVRRRGPGARRAAGSRAAEVLGLMADAVSRVAASLERLRGAGIEPRRLTMIGAPASSSVWPTLVAGAVGIEVDVAPAGSWPAVGAARLA